ncbi:MAG: winged helix-turn-helix domain-containing protein [Chlorobaculum sp.]|nr:winged helix-turn-helix domain-containing protein [Chlorobaculum sp.]
MARPATGKEVLTKTKEALATVRTTQALRQAQAVILPLEQGLSMDQVASVPGISKSWACKLRCQFIRQGGVMPETKPTQGGRRRENITFQQETVFLAPFFEKAARGGILMVCEIKQALDQRLGRTTALTSTCNLLHQNNLRKLAPDKRHPNSDPEAQEEFKKNSRN